MVTRFEQCWTGKPLQSDLSYGMMLDMYSTVSQTKYKLIYHLVWIPKYRKRVLQGDLAQRLVELFEECADMNQWKIEELNIHSDHVHMLVEIEPNIKLCDAVQRFKGGSSKEIRKEFPELREFLWGNNFWADGCFAETCGSESKKAIWDYINNH